MRRWEAKLTWLSSEVDALALARASARPLVIFLHADYCTWCRKMEANTFHDSRVRLLGEQFVLCRLNGEKEGKPLIARYKVQRYPFQVILASDGNLQTTAPDYHDADKYVQLLATQLPASQLARLEQAQSWPTLAVVCAERGDLKGATLFLSRAPQDPTACYAVGKALVGKGDHTTALPLLQTALAAATEPHEAIRLRLMTADCLAGLGRKPDAIALLEPIGKLKGADGDEKKSAAERLKQLRR